MPRQPKINSFVFKLLLTFKTKIEYHEKKHYFFSTDIAMLFLSKSQTQQFNHPRDGYGVTLLIEGNFGTMGSAYPHNFWQQDSSTTGATVFQQVIDSNYTFIGISGIGSNAWDNQTPYWDQLDLAYNYAKQHKFKMRFNFGPGYSTPNWITGTYPERRTQYLNRITDILTRYPDVDEWNFCNEITTHDNLNTLLDWTNVEMVVNISQHARHVLDSICSDAKLLTNDYGIIATQDNWNTTQRDNYIQLYIDALAQGAELDYVGLEGHIFTWNSSDPSWNPFFDNISYWRHNVELIDSLIGLPIVFTEFDISMPWNSNDMSWFVNPDTIYTDPITNVSYTNLWEWQADAYRTALDTLRSFSSVYNITNSGFDDGEMAWNAWVGYVYAIQLNDTVLHPKPAYFTVSPLMQDYHQLPNAEFDITSGNIAGEKIFDATESFDRNGNITSYNWDFGDGNNGTDAFTTHVYNTQGVFDVRLVVTDNDNNTDTLFETINVCWTTQTIDTTINQGDSVLFGNHYYSTDGTYNVLLTDSDDCHVLCDSTAILNLSTISTSLNNVAENSFKIYPNPTNGISNIISNNSLIGSYIKVYSIDGRKIIQFEINSKKSSIDLSKETKGVYLIKIISENEVFTKKLILR